MFSQMLGIFEASFMWLVTWVYYVVIICFVGAIAGVVSHVGFGLLFLESPDLGYLWAFGFLNGLRYGSVWAGGAAIVLCVMRARKEFLQRQSLDDHAEHVR